MRQETNWRDERKQVSASNPHFRAFLLGTVWFAAIAFKMVSRSTGSWASYPPKQLIVVVVGWVITALVLGFLATKFAKLRSWWGIGIGTVLGSFAVMGFMLFLVTKIYGPAPPTSFKSTDEQMVYLADLATQWVRKDRGIKLDYSLDSIKTIEEELDRISKEVNKTNPQKGTFGTATGYGAYIGEVFRRRDGGTWSVDHAVAGPGSYPLTTKSNGTIFPVGWCWKRLTLGDEDNVYHKALVFSEKPYGRTNSILKE